MPCKGPQPVQLAWSKPSRYNGCVPNSARATLMGALGRRKRPHPTLHNPRPYRSRFAGWLKGVVWDNQRRHFQHLCRSLIAGVVPNLSPSQPFAFDLIEDYTIANGRRQLLSDGIRLFCSTIQASAILDMIVLMMVFLSRKNGQDHVQ